jgi:hypothetical protein
MQIQCYQMFANLKKQVKNYSADFLDPLLEAVTNSIQAKAKFIEILFDLDQNVNFFDNQYRINGFTIIDHGDGFDPTNIERFCELESDHGLDQKPNKKGCKGIGRLSYLKVFKDVRFLSFDGEKSFDFKLTLDFKSEDIKPTKKIQYKEKGTRIEFSNITDEFLSYNKNGSIKIDKRQIFDPESIKKSIIKELMPLLYFNKKENITIKIGKDATITAQDIPDFEKMEPFILENNANKEKYEFTLLYHFADEKNEPFVEAFYCANQKTVCKFSDKGIKINPLDGKSMYLLLISDFFDQDHVTNKERNDFNIKPKEVNQDTEIPFNWDYDINPQLKIKINELLKDKITDFNKKQNDQKTKIINKRPYLTKYILKDDSIVILDEENAIKDAQSSWNKERNECLGLIDKGEKLTPEQRVKIKETVAIELAEYMWIRYQILKELETLVANKEKNEAKIHNIILPKGKKLDEDTLLMEDIYHNNLWIIDDRFMSYRYAFSDKKIKEIKQIVDMKYTGSCDLDSKEPDIAVTFDGLLNDSNDLRGMIIELKSFMATLEDNEKGVSQLDRYRSAFFDFENIKEKYYYLITSNIDDTFDKLLIEEKGYDKIFSSSGAMYIDKAYRQKYIIPIETLINECKRRHDLFFNIIKNSGTKE